MLNELVIVFLANNDSLTKLELPPKFDELKNEILERAKETAEKDDREKN